MKTKWLRLPAKYKVIMLVVLVIVITGASLAGIIINQQKKHERMLAVYQELLDDREAQLTQLQSEADAMTQDSYLKKDLTQEEITGLNQRLSEIQPPEMDEDYRQDFYVRIQALKEKQGELSRRLDELQRRWGIQEALNALFEKPVLTGKAAVKNPIAAKALTVSDAAETKRRYYQSGEDLDAWQQDVDRLLDEAENQARQMETVKNYLEQSVQKNVLAAEVTPEWLRSLKAEIGEIKNETVRRDCMAQADELSRLLEDKVRKIAEKKAAEIGGTAQKQADGSYKITAKDASEYRVSASGEVSRTDEASKPENGAA